MTENITNTSYKSKADVLELNRGMMVILQFTTVIYLLGNYQCPITAGGVPVYFIAPLSVQFCKIKSIY